VEVILPVKEIREVLEEPAPEEVVVVVQVLLEVMLLELILEVMEVMVYPILFQDTQLTMLVVGEEALNLLRLIDQAV
jgi:hypothetical protein